jgi:hypothetical protein
LEYEILWTIKEKPFPGQNRQVYFVRGFSCFRSVKKEIQPGFFVSFGSGQKKGEKKDNQKHPLRTINQECYRGTPIQWFNVTGKGIPRFPLSGME